jgi:hypothetical protein
MAVTLRMPVQYGPRVIDMSWSYPKARAFRDVQRAFGDASLHVPDALIVGEAEGAERVPGEVVEASYFRILGVDAAHGRVFADEEDSPAGGAPVVVISDGYWRRRFTGQLGAIGSRVDVNGECRLPQRAARQRPAVHRHRRPPARIPRSQRDERPLGARHQRAAARRAHGSDDAPVPDDRAPATRRDARARTRLRA